MNKNDAAVSKAQIALLNETTVHFTAEAFEEFCVLLDAPVAEVPEKVRERLSRPAPWKTAKGS